ncbi:MAG: hypothetical protein Kow00117_16730 [Phototrophicales bacterium]|nr:MAG: hypothetical protein CUN56_14050 [Phototrophicales bacterium]RMG72592.1 MAG: hypothetical protein D6711_12655 [Chloroflexota bacterium]
MIENLLKRVEKLSTTQLEEIHQYMATRPYRLEERSPTPEEQQAVIQALQEFVEQATPLDDQEEARLAGLGDFKLSDA